VKSPIIIWLSNNWFGILSLLVGVWVALALRPRPRLRFWTVGQGASQTYFPASTRTTLYIRNVGNQPIDNHQWRTPLSVECKADISDIDATGVSNADIEASAELIEDNPKEAILKLSHLNPGDEAQFNIKHGRVSSPPQLKGELLSTRDTLARGRTLKQRFAGTYSLAFVLIVDYVEITSIAWLTHSRLTFGGVMRGIVFLLASPFLFIATAPAMRRRTLQKRPMRVLAVAGIVFIVGMIMKIAAVCIAWLSGFQLWYPEFAIYVVATYIIMLTMGVQEAKMDFGLSGPGISVSPAIASFSAALGQTIFAVLVIAGASRDVLIPVGLASILIIAVIRLDRQRLRQRISIAIGTPRGRSMLYPPQKTGPLHVRNDHESIDENALRKTTPHDEE